MSVSFHATIVDHALAATTFQRTGAQYNQVRACTYFAHAATQPIDVERELTQSIIGAIHGRCAESLMNSMLLTCRRGFGTFRDFILRSILLARKRCPDT